VSGLPNRALWLLVIVHLAKKVDGITRLHKLAFLAKELVPGMERVEFYDDWKAGKYGPFSPTLGSDISDLISESLIQSQTIHSSAGYPLERYTVSPSGVNHAVSLEGRYPKICEMIQKSIVDKYANAPLMSLLHDVYYLFPQYTVESEIAGEVFGITRRD
jgi:uncharacterized protein YwgA